MREFKTPDSLETGLRKVAQISSLPVCVNPLPFKEVYWMLCEDMLIHQSRYQQRLRDFVIHFLAVPSRRGADVPLEAVVEVAQIVEPARVGNVDDRCVS